MRSRILAGVSLFLFAPALFAACDWVTTSSTVYTNLCSQVGIGTSAPSSLLHIKGSSPGLRLEDSGYTGALLLLETDSGVGPLIAAHTDENNNATAAAAAHRILLGGGGLKLERGDSATIGTARTWVTRFTFDQTNFVFSTPGSSYTGIKLSNSGTTSGRMHMAIGDWVGLTINAKYEANNWELDDPNKPGWFLKLDGRTSQDLMAVYRVPTGSGGHTDEVKLLELDNSGDLWVRGTVTADNQDIAEWVPVTESMAVGTVVVLNPVKTNEVMPSSRPYDVTVAGVVSDRPGVLLGRAGNDKAKIATTGRVKVLVDATVTPVRIGDLLVTSEKPGLAMVSVPVDVAGTKMHRPGTIIGKAIEARSGGVGEVLVLLSMQ